MILSKSLAVSKNTFIGVLKQYKIPSSHIHCFRLNVQTISNTSLPAINHIFYRCESSQVANKDKILNLPSNAEPVSSISKSVNDELPDIQLVPANSTETTTISDIPDIISEASVPLNKLGEPVLQSLNLGSYYTPVGWVQNILEFVHCNFSLPWWGSIAVCVVIVRILMFPLVIKQQRNSIKMHNVMPKMMDIQMRLQNARMYGNDVEVMKTGNELAEFMKKNQINPASGVSAPLIQAPIFISFFMGLRAMANTPVESMTWGGMLWFTDLTLQDQYYILPLITCTTLFFVIQIGAEFNRAPTGGAVARYLPIIFKGIPVVVFPFIMHFPAACVVYWATNNVVTLAQVLLLRAPGVRDYFGISEKKKIDPTEIPNRVNKNVVKDIKSTFANFRIAKEISERQRLDEMAFRRAGKMPPAKTFKENPLTATAEVQK